MKSNNILNFTNSLSEYDITPQIFPIARITSMNWNKALMLIILGNFELPKEELEVVPYKTSANNLALKLIFFLMK